MQQSSDKKAIVEAVRNEIEASKGTRIWQDYVNALKLISQVVFTRSSGFILELLQNAEDAGLGLKNPGIFEININETRVKVVHNARTFSDDDVRAVCGISSSKKPEKGTLGYLGIGFKSVFKVTDCPEIYSNGFQFKFDRNHPDWLSPVNTPWHVLPIWIDEPSEMIDNRKTTFIIPLREGIDRKALLKEIDKLRTELYLFLRWIKFIKISDEASGRAWTLESKGENQEGISTLKRGTEEHRFKIFRSTIQVPDSVKQDRLTQEYRANVTNREIAIAFALDKDDNLAPSEAGAMYGGVYSFLPLGEAKSGAKFPIQADFLVQPGRDAINYEAKWNHWLVQEVVALCQMAIEDFKNNPKWKYQFLPAFEFTKTKGMESYENLFGPELISPIENLLENSECIPTEDGGWAKPSEVVKFTEGPKASKDLIDLGILGKSEIASVLRGITGVKLAQTNVKDHNLFPLKKVDRWYLVGNSAFLQRKCKDVNAADWFRYLYIWLSRNPIHIIGRGQRVTDEDYQNDWKYRDVRTYKYNGVENYYDENFILTADGRLMKGRDVYSPDRTSDDPNLRDLTETLQKQKPILHPEILAGAKDEQEQKALKGFLTDSTGVQILDSKKVCKEAILLLILTKASRPSPTELLKYTTICQSILGKAIGQGSGLWVVSKNGAVKPAREVLFPKEFKPEQDWETNNKYLTGLSFLNTLYIGNNSTDEQLKGWRDFFKAGGIKDKPDNGVEDFAIGYTCEWLRTFCQNVELVDKRNYGYDIRSETKRGDTIYVEVKGLSIDNDINLTVNEAEAVLKYGEHFYLCVVTSIPDNPRFHPVKNPASVGKTLTLTVPKSVWKTAKP